jgi:hypothetical protein
MYEKFSTEMEKNWVSINFLCVNNYKTCETRGHVWNI